MKTPKELIVDEYRKHKVPITVENFCTKYKEILPGGSKQLSESGILDNVLGLSIEQVNELIEFYGNGFLFSPEIEENVQEYLATKEKIDSIEQKRT